MVKHDNEGARQLRQSDHSSRASHSSQGSEPQVIAVFGATSEIGEEIAHRLAEIYPQARFALAGRRRAPLDRLAAQLPSQSQVFDFDAQDTASHASLIEQIEADLGDIDLALAMFGVLGDQELAESDGGEVARILHTDFTAQAVLLTELTARMKTRKAGTVVAFSSIAGARVRRPNYVYGSAKAGLDGFCQGMQDALVGTGVRLLVVRPGFVIGRMTEGMDPAPMSVTPDVVADGTVAAIADNSRRFFSPQDDVWVPGKLKLLAFVMQWVPRWLWRRAPR